MNEPEDEPEPLMGPAMLPAPTGAAAAANFAVLRGIAEALEAKAQFEALLELDEEDSDSEDEFVASLGKCARELAQGVRPTGCLSK
jgi:hypothetical protein